MESFEHAGYFWLPEEAGMRISQIPQNAIPGTLSFDPATGGSLELLGNIDATDPFGINPWKKYDIVHGTVKGNSHCVTLRDCIMYSMSSGLMITDTKLMVSCIYMGHHYWFDSVEDIVFEKLTVGYTYLDDWMSQNNFRSDWTHSDDYKRLLSFDLSYVSPEPIEIPLENAKIEISSRLSGGPSANEISMKNEHRITICPHEPLKFDEYLDFINFHLPNFFILATGHTNYLVSIGGMVSEDRDGMRIYFKQFRYIEKRKPITTWQMLFTFDDVKDKLPKYLSNWINKFDQLRPVLEEFFYVESHTNLALEMQFLALTRALEGYHRITCGGAYLTPEEYKPIKETLIAAIPRGIAASHRNKIKEMLKFGYEYSLRKRFKIICNEVLADFSETIEELLGNSNSFISAVIEVRNGLTHPDVDIERKEKSHSELFDYVRKMRMLLRICFLYELGFPSDEVKRLLRANQEYQALTKKDEE